jgi:hypothetical protein
LLDPCGFALFSDDRGRIFEAHPTALVPASRSSSRPPGSVPSASAEASKSLSP